MATYGDNPPPYSPPGPAGQAAPPYPNPHQGYPQSGHPQSGYPPKGAYPAYPSVGQSTPGATVVVQSSPQPVIPAQNVVVVRAGNCPYCVTGYIVEDFSCCGIVLAILFFPIGLLCCLLMRNRYCNNCGRNF